MEIPETRICTQCLKEKNLETDFGKQSNGKYGRQSACRQCTKEILKAYRKTPKGKAKYLEYAKRHREKPGYAEKHKGYRNYPKGKWSAYKKDAQRRGYAFEFSLERFTELFWQKPCFYCGSINKTAGVDRLNNEGGYTESNSVPCCYTCNIMKLKSPVLEFIEQCKKIARRHGLV